MRKDKHSGKLKCTYCDAFNDQHRYVCMYCGSALEGDF